MADRYARPDWVRRLNLMAASVGGGADGARQIVPLDGEAMLAAGLDAFGAASNDFGDPDWEARFLSLVRGVDAAGLSVVGRLMTRQELLRGLRARLALMHELDAEPAIADERIVAPVIVTGPARSGTSILFELLWLDPALRAPLAWEALHPVAPAAGADVRGLATEAEQELWADVQPEFAAIHELRSDLPVECVTLTLPCFSGSHWPMIVQMGEWIPDMALAYDYERRVLQSLQHGAEPCTWLLKTPGHLMTLEMVFDAFPDAWVVQTHRDPVKTMPSTVSTTAMVQWLRKEDVDLDVLAQLIGASFAAALNQSVELRESGAVPARFVDVHFQELLKDPVETLRAAYGAMERDFGEEHAEAIRRYLAEKPQGKFGQHKYEAADWGFEAATVRRDLEPYIEHFGVASETG